MDNETLCVAIPDELLQYAKVASMLSDDKEQDEKQKAVSDFGVKIIKDKDGNLVCTAYYSNSGELIKKIFYIGSSVSGIEHYRNNSLYSHEKFNNGKICKKSKFDNSGKAFCTVKYDYNKKDQITAICKIINSISYQVDYGYDALMRPDSRTVKINNKPAAEQRFKFDILDRIVEYKDNYQTINVKKINSNNDLISYTITDKSGNEISILNKFLCSEYLGSEIELNGHKTTIKDYSYVDNVMLKSPFPSEDDLDFTISNIFKQKSAERACKTKRSCNTDILSTIIDKSLNLSQKVLPISVRKQMLLKNSVA